MDLFDFLEDTQKIKIDLKPWMSDGVHKVILCTAEMLPKVIDDCIASGLYGIDTEGTGLDTRVFDGETVAKLVGCCLSPDGKTGYYIPLRHKVGAQHNVPFSLWKREMARLINSDARAIFHNAKYDQEMLQFCGGEPVGEWDDPKKWEDTLILAYLRDTRAKQKGLKFLAKTELDMEMIELEDLFPKDKVKSGQLDFSELDPSWEVVPWYAGSDALIARKLYDKLAPKVLDPGDGLPGQGLIYGIEKLCVTATRWMERARIMTDQEKAKELIRIGQKEWLESISEVYTSASEIVGRDISPGYYRILMGRQPGYEDQKFDVSVVQPGYMVRVDEARLTADKNGLDPTFKDAKKKVRVQTIQKRVPSIATKGVMEEVDFPLVYDILVPEELGALLRECKVPGLTVTEKSGQVATNQEELERVLEEAGDKYPFAAKIKRFREVSKALGTYLLPLIEDSAPDGSIRIHYNAHKIDTGRFAVSSSRNPALDGGTRFPIHGTPATYDPKRPECMGRIRECIISRPGKIIAACVAKGELVHTGRGFLPIEDVVSGDRVVTDDGLRDVTWAGYTGSKPVVKLTTSKGITLRLTEDHRVYTTGDNGLEWKTVGEMKPGDWVVHAWDHIVGGSVELPPTPVFTPHEKTIRTPSVMTGDLAEFLGRFMGDGSISHLNGVGRSINFSLGLDVDELLPHLNGQADTLFGISFKHRERGDVTCSSNPLCRWVDDVTGKGQSDVRGLSVPPSIMRGGSNIHAMFLRGLFDADGSVGSRSGDGLSLWVTSPKMALEVQVLLHGLGIHTKRVCSERTTNFGHIVGYAITVSGIRPLQRFRGLVGFTTQRKKDSLDRLVGQSRNRDYSSTVPLDIARKAVRYQRRNGPMCITRGRRAGRVTFEDLEACLKSPTDTDALALNQILTKDWFFDTVVSVKPDGESDVYDLHVPEGSRFTVNSVVVHNCDFSGVELRIATNMSREPKWLREFFHCSSCDRMFPAGDGTSTPPPPPPFCPDCGSDKIGDLHTLTGISIYGDDSPKRPDWKKLRGNAKCVHPDTLIFLDGDKSGLAPIRSLPVGDLGEFHYSRGYSVLGPNGQFVHVNSVFNGEPKELFHVVTRRGILTCSAEHRFKLSDGTLRSIQDGLSKGDQLAESPIPTLKMDAPSPIPHGASEDTPPVWIHPNLDHAYFAGLFLGDGCKCGTTTVSLAHGQVDKTDQLGVSYSSWQDILVDACERVGFRPVRRKMSVYLGSRSVMRYLSSLSLVDGVGGGRTLRIPQWILDGGREFILTFLGGLFDTDGYIGKRDASMRWCTKDAVFAGQIAAVLSALGFQPSVSPSWNKTYQRDYFIVGVRASDILSLKPYLRHPGKMARVRVVPPHNLTHHNRVLKVIPAGVGPCRDVSLDSEDHLYWTNGLVTHNSTNFALVYGGGGNAVVLALEGEIDKAEGWRIKEVFDKTYKGLSAWWKEQHKFARQHKFVTTAFGRRYPLPDIDHEMGGFRAKAERNAVNGPIQGLSADITKLAMGLIYKECKKRGWLEKVHMLITMHDELVFEIDMDILEEAIDTFVNIMCRNPALLKFKWPIPLTSDVEMGYSWMVPWDLKKIRHTGQCPPELAGCFKGIKVKDGSSKESEKPKQKSLPIKVYKISSLSVGSVEDLAHMLWSSKKVKPANPASLKIEGPDGDDLTALMLVLWGGPLPEVEADATVTN